MFRLSIALFFAFACSFNAQAQEEVFSGPQVGEKLPEFTAKYLRGKKAGEEFKVLKSAGDKPLFVIFWHGLDRPGFSIMRTLTQYTASKSEKLQTMVVCLDDDPEAPKFSRGLGYFDDKTHLAVSTDGSEGPGSYGLNRNVRLTILVGKEGKVTGNYALIQPSTQADGPKILKSIAAAIGEDGPDLEALQGAMTQRMNARRGAQEKMKREGADRVQSDRPARGGDQRLDGMLRRIINKDLTDEQVAKVGKAILEYVERNDKAKQDLARRAKGIVDSGKLSNYGTQAAQEVIKGWAKKYAEKDGDSKEESSDKK